MLSLIVPTFNGAQNVPETAMETDSGRDCAVHLATIALLLAACVALIQPFRNVALGDDAAYIRMVQRLLQDHVLKVPEHSSPALVFQGVWAWVLTAPFQFSISGTIATVLPLALAGLLAFYGILFDFTRSRGIALLGCLALLTNPLYLRLVTSFMTDVPFVSLALVTAYFYLQGMKTSKYGYYFAGSFTASCALLTRQIGIGLVVAVIAAVIWDCLLFRRRRPWAELAAASILPLLAFAAYLVWVYRFGGQTWAQTQVMTAGTARYVTSRWFAVYLAYELIRYSIWLVFLSVPLLALRWRRVFAHLRSALHHPVQILIVLGFAFTLARLAIGPAGPYFTSGGVLEWMGLKVVMGSWTWIALPLLTMLAAIVRGEIEFFRRNRSLASITAPVFFTCLLAGGFLLAACLMPVGRFDRYLLPVLPFVWLLWLAGAAAQRPARSAAVAFFVLFAVWGVGSTRLLYDLAEVQWREADALVAAGVPRNEIRANVAWEVYWFSENCLQNAVAQGRAAQVTAYCWGTTLNTPYRIKVLATGRQSVLQSPHNYRIVKSVPVYTFGMRSTVAVLRLDEPASHPSIVP